MHIVTAMDGWLRNALPNTMAGAASLPVTAELPSHGLYKSRNPAAGFRWPLKEVRSLVSTFPCSNTLRYHVVL